MAYQQRQYNSFSLIHAYSSSVLCSRVIVSLEKQRKLCISSRLANLIAITYRAVLSCRLYFHGRPHQTGSPNCNRDVAPSNCRNTPTPISIPRCLRPSSILDRSTICLEIMMPAIWYRIPNPAYTFSSTRSGNDFVKLETRIHPLYVCTVCTRH